MLETIKQAIRSSIAGLFRGEGAPAEKALPPASEESPESHEPPTIPYPATTTAISEPDPSLRIICERLERSGVDQRAYLARTEDWCVSGYALDCHSEALRALTEHPPTMHPHEWPDNTYLRLRSRRALEKEKQACRKS